ncbi:MAG: beta-lactamase family protein [Candidatus Latescibacteria bacterium]|nr:beta-lactamase family protein [Candidatus Latescibacterota bacterium]
MKLLIRCITLSLIFMYCFNGAVNAEVLPKTKPEKVGLSGDRIERIDKALTSWVNDEKIAGAVTMIARHGKIAHIGVYGSQDREAGVPMSEDTIFAIASMTKPITSLAVLMLYEEGHFLLSDPISKYIPAFENMRVVLPGYEDSEDPPTVPAKRPITIRHLLLHTAGLSYGSGAHAIHYRKAGISELRSPEHTIEEMTLAIVKLPLLFHPGDDYCYSLSDDVLGYFVEVISGMPFDQFIEERIFKPLGMNDTSFYVPEDKKHRLAALYQTLEDSSLEKRPPNKKDMSKPSEQRHFSGGGGLYSTVYDYALFCQMLLNGGELNGVRLVSRKTVEMLSANGIGDIDPKLREGGDKWGLGGVSVRTKYFTDVSILPPGCYMKTGAYTTHFWINPSDDMFGIFMIQLQPLNWDLMHLYMVLGTQAITD